MFRKSLIFISVVALACVTASAQTPGAKKEKEKAVQGFAWSFDGDGGYLGVQTQEVNKENFAKFGLAGVRGVAVEKVMENSPAATAGIQNGDVIVKFNGEEITSVRKLTRLIGEVDPDHQVSITVVRGGSERDINVTLGKRPMPKFENGNFAFSVPSPMGKLEMPPMANLPNMPDAPQAMITPDGEGKLFTWRAGAGRQIGIGVTPLTKQLAEHFGVDGGAMINNVRENSPAAKAGLKAGDIIVEADGKAVKGDIDLIRTINGKKEGDVQLTIVRDGSRQTISVTPEASKDNGFVFQVDDEEGLTPLAPGQFKLASPAMPMSAPSTMTAPITAPAPITLVRPGRVL